MKIKFKEGLVRIYIKTLEITLEEFCERCDITQEAYMKIVNGGDCSVFTLYKIARILHVDILHLLEEVE